MLSILLTIPLGLTDFERIDPQITSASVKIISGCYFAYVFRGTEGKHTFFAGTKTIAGIFSQNFRAKLAYLPIELLYHLRVKKTPRWLDRKLAENSITT